MFGFWKRVNYQDTNGLEFKETGTGYLELDSGSFQPEPEFLNHNSGSY